MLEQIHDGWTLAEADMASRGFGDLDAEGLEQSGFESSILFGRPLTASAVEEVAALCSKLPTWNSP
jgi:RecG-like helicase